MADVQTGGDQGSGKGKKRAKKSSTHIDMTPMVDLAFLLLTFFILTTTMSKPSIMKLTFPVDPKDEKDKKEMKVPNAVTMILTKDDVILYYKGELSDSTTFTKTNFKEVRKVLVGMNRWAVEEINALNREFNKQVGNDKEKAKAMEKDYKEKKQKIMKDNRAMFCIIKPDKVHAKYRNMIDIVDEMDISGIGKYAVSDKFAEAEIKYLEQFNK